MIRLVKATDPIVVERPIFLLYGGAGRGKTTLGYSAPTPLLLDFDRGAHRAAFRADTVSIDRWGDIVTLLQQPSTLDPYETIVLDTVGRCLDLMTVDLLTAQPRLARDGVLTQQGWGVLRLRFKTFVDQLRATGRHVLFLAHEREDREGEERLLRPDVPGGSYGELLKSTDFIGWIGIQGRDQRVLDFSPTEQRIGKNPGNWPPMPIPLAECRDLLTRLFAQAREVLGRVSAEAASLQQQVQTWEATIEASETAEALTEALAAIQQAPPTVQPFAKRALWARAKALGFTYRNQQFVPTGASATSGGAAVNRPESTSQVATHVAAF